MSKDDALWGYIRENKSGSCTLTFEEIQRIAGVPIDHSFLHDKKALAAYGWQVGKISLKEQAVTFTKL